MDCRGGQWPPVIHSPRHLTDKSRFNVWVSVLYCLCAVPTQLINDSDLFLNQKKQKTHQFVHKCYRHWIFGTQICPPWTAQIYPKHLHAAHHVLPRNLTVKHVLCMYLFCPTGHVKKRVGTGEGEMVHLGMVGGGSMVNMVEWENESKSQFRIQIEIYIIISFLWSLFMTKKM